MNVLPPSAYLTDTPFLTNYEDYHQVTVQYPDGKKRVIDTRGRQIIPLAPERTPGDYQIVTDDESVSFTIMDAYRYGDGIYRASYFDQHALYGCLAMSDRLHFINTATGHKLTINHLQISQLLPLKEQLVLGINAPISERPYGGEISHPVTFVLIDLKYLSVQRMTINKQPSENHIEKASSSLGGTFLTGINRKNQEKLFGKQLQCYSIRAIIPEGHEGVLIWSSSQSMIARVQIDFRQRVLNPLQIIENNYDKAEWTPFGMLWTKKAELMFLRISNEARQRIKTTPLSPSSVVTKDGNVVNLSVPETADLYNVATGTGKQVEIKAVSSDDLLYCGAEVGTIQGLPHFKEKLQQDFVGTEDYKKILDSTVEDTIAIPTELQPQETWEYDQVIGYGEAAIVVRTRATIAIVSINRHEKNASPLFSMSQKHIFDGNELDSPVLAYSKGMNTTLVQYDNQILGHEEEVIGKLKTDALLHPDFSCHLINNKLFHKTPGKRLSEIGEDSLLTRREKSIYLGGKDSVVNKNNRFRGRCLRRVRSGQISQLERGSNTPTPLQWQDSLDAPFNVDENLLGVDDRRRILDVVSGNILGQVAHSIEGIFASGTAVLTSSGKRLFLEVLRAGQFVPLDLHIDMVVSKRAFLTPLGDMLWRSVDDKQRYEIINLAEGHSQGFTRQQFVAHITEAGISRSTLDSAIQKRLFDPKTLKLIPSSKLDQYVFTSPDGRIYIQSSISSDIAYYYKATEEVISKSRYGWIKHHLKSQNGRQIFFDRYPDYCREAGIESPSQIEPQKVVSWHRTVYIGFVGNEPCSRLLLPQNTRYYNYAAFSSENTFVSVVGKDIFAGGFIQLTYLNVDADQKKISVLHNSFYKQETNMAAWICGIDAYHNVAAHDSFPKLYSLSVKGTGSSNIRVRTENYQTRIGFSFLQFSPSGRFMACSNDRYEAISTGGGGHVDANDIHILRSFDKEILDTYQDHGGTVKYDRSKKYVPVGFSDDERMFMTHSTDGVSIVRRLSLEAQ